MQYKLYAPQGSVRGSITLPASKSISNRLLIIDALIPQGIRIHNLSDSQDTKIIKQALQNNYNTVDVGQAGAAMRFLTAYYAQKPGEWIITGTDRMKKRPIGELVRTLRQLGAHISYLEKEGFPPLKIYGQTLEGSTATIDASISSQYITALLLIAPSLPGGLTLHLTNTVASLPYIKLTLYVMQYFGIRWEWNNNTITVAPQSYITNDITVEADWSAASYWYEMVALAEDMEVTISGLHRNSFQGDAVISRLFDKIGVQTNWTENTVLLRKQPVKTQWFTADFSYYPDLVQTLVVTCVMNQIPCTITGAQSLKIKETDRIAALINELAPFGYILQETSEGVLEWHGRVKQFLSNNSFRIHTYNDHRMAMAFAPAAFKYNGLIISDPDVVAKSYPSFWSDLEQIGFSVNRYDA